MLARASLVSFAVCFLALAAACEKPETTVIVDNDYPPTSTNALVVYRAHWQAVTFVQPVSPGASSEPEPTVAASANTAYVVLAPGWDPNSGAAPTSLVVLESTSGFDVHLNGTLHIPVSDSTFAGNCAASSFLSRADSDFITRQVFRDVFAGFDYDPSTCTLTPLADAGAGDAP